MNKLVKGSIAGGLGVVLLLGGAGTLALWNQSALVAGGSVTSGVLTLKADSAAATWTDISPELASGGVSIPNIANYRIVPGDTIKFTQTVKVVATGTNLKAKLNYDPTTIVLPTATGTAQQIADTNAINQALKDNLTVVVGAVQTAPTVVAPATTVITPSGTANEWLVSPTVSETTVTVTATITFPTAVTGVVAQAGTVDLTKLGFKLTQVRP